jgi:hypothetical protein
MIEVTNTMGLRHHFQFSADHNPQQSICDMIRNLLEEGP